MTIIEKNVKDLIPYKNNAKKHDETQIKNVAESIKQFGFVQPIVIEQNNVVVIGHCRLAASKLLNLEKVPCYLADDLDEEQIQKLRNLDNKLNESEWDFELLANDIADLDFSDFEIEWNLPTVVDDNLLNELFEDEKTKEKHPKKCKCPNCGEEFEL